MRKRKKKTASDHAQEVEIERTRLLTPIEVAAHLGVALQTLAAWRCGNINPLPYIKIGSRVRYRRSDVEKFVADHKN